jgi:hypothetical protein
MMPTQPQAFRERLATGTPRDELRMLAAGRSSAGWSSLPRSPSPGPTGLSAARRLKRLLVAIALVDGDADAKSVARPVRSVRSIVRRWLGGPSAPTGAAPLPAGQALAVGPGLGCTPAPERSGSRVQVAPRSGPPTCGTSVAGFTRTGMRHAVRALACGADHQAEPDDPTHTTAQMRTGDRVARWSA